MDFGKFRTCDWLLVAGGAVMLVFGQALDWASSESGISGNGPFTYFFTGGIAYLLVVAAGVLAFLLAGGFIDAGTTPWTRYLLAGTGLATLLMLVRVLLGADTDGVDLDRQPGMWVALLAAAVALAGAVIDFRSTGATWKDLLDVSSWTPTSSDALPPPPAGPDQAGPPPPPPPGAGGPTSPTPPTSSTPPPPPPPPV